MTVRARGLVVHRGRRPAAGPVDLNVEAGERVLLDGPSGCGKSSVLKALGGLLAVAGDARVAGALDVAGLDPMRAPARELASRVGSLFQAAEEQLLAFDVEGEIRHRLETVGAPDAERRATEALRRWALEPMAERPSSDLSAGEAKRVAVAAALAVAPRALLLDEPFTGLDPAWRERLAADVRAASRGDVAVVLAEHGAREARALATGVITMGRATEPERPASRSARPGGAPLARVDAALARGGVDVLRADLTLAPGFVALVGPNGAGKTTLLRALAGLDAPAAGTVRVADLDAPHRAASRDLARRVGWSGHLALDAFTAARAGDEMGLTPRALGSPFEAGTHAARFGLAALADRHPMSLSGGERQRLALAAAFAHEPRVVLLDEPTVGLDAAARAALERALDDARARGGLVVAATHDERLIARADEVVVARDGRAESVGSPESFFGAEARRLGYELPREVPA